MWALLIQPVWFQLSFPLTHNQSRLVSIWGLAWRPLLNTVPLVKSWTPDRKREFARDDNPSKPSGTQLNSPPCRRLNTTWNVWKSSWKTLCCWPKEWAVHLVPLPKCKACSAELDGKHVLSNAINLCPPFESVLCGGGLPQWWDSADSWSALCSDGEHLHLHIRD